MKQVIASILALCMLISMMPGILALEERRAESENELIPMDRTDPPTAFGIDVSHWQGDIDWDRVAPQIDFAIIRCGYGDDLEKQDDKYWFQNADACTRLGIPFGVYLMSYAVTDAQARSEAQHVLRLVEGYDLTLPIYLDLEDTKYILPNCSNEDILRHAKIFCEIIENAGYECGIYSNYNWWTNYLTSPEYDQWDRWFARYASAPGYSKDYTIWQYTEEGTMAGINGYVDMNHWYGPFPGSHEHSYTSSVTRQPTCTQSGVRTYTCSCGEYYTEIISPTGHTYSAQVTQPTCTAQGYTTHTCTVCGHSYKDSYTSAKGHSFKDGLCTECGMDDPNALMAGDLDGDGTVTSADAVLLARYLVDLTELTDKQLQAADVDHDGAVTSGDSVRLARFLAGVITAL